MKNFTCISFIKKVKENKNFDHFFKLEILKSDKKIKVDCDVLLVPDKFLKNVEQGRKLLFKLFEIKKRSYFLIAIEGTKEYGKNKIYLELKKEKLPIVDIFFPYLEGKDFMHSANSGVNHVLLNVLHRNKIAIGINLKELIGNLKKKNYAYLSKIIQNIRWARKKKVNFCVFINAKKSKDIPDALDIFHFLLAIGFDTKQAKNALVFGYIKRELNKEIFKHKIKDVYIYRKDEKIKLIDYLKAIEA